MRYLRIRADCWNCEGAEEEEDKGESMLLRDRLRDGCHESEMETASSELYPESLLERRLFELTLDCELESFLLLTMGASRSKS